MIENLYAHFLFNLSFLTLYCWKRYEDKVKKKLALKQDVNYHIWPLKNSNPKLGLKDKITESVSVFLIST